jgi:hypothetical protein
MAQQFTLGTARVEPPPSDFCASQKSRQIEIKQKLASKLKLSVSIVFTFQCGSVCKKRSLFC